jgi:hypothetical protein
MHILRPSGILYGLFVYYVIIWYIFDHLVNISSFGILYQEKCGNTGCYALQNTYVCKQI